MALSRGRLHRWAALELGEPIGDLAHAHLRGAHDGSRAAFCALFAAIERTASRPAYAALATAVPTASPAAAGAAALNSNGRWRARICWGISCC